MAEYDERDVNALAAAILTVYGVNQDGIAQRLNLPSQSEVSRIVKYAKEQGWLKWALSLPNDPELRRAAEVKAYADLDKLTHRLDEIRNDNEGYGLTNVQVIYSGDDDATDEERIRLFGKNCAEYVMQQLDQVKVCAVAWGKTIQSVVAGIEERSPKHIPDLTFMPLCGEPLNHAAPGISSSTAAEKLSTAFDCKKLTLRGVGVRIPKDLAKHAKIIEEYIQKSKDYSRIFSKPAGLIRNVDAIITGLGDAETSVQDPWFSETMEAEELTAEEMRKLAVGNLGGVWFPRDPNNNQQRVQINEMNTRWLGIKREDFDSLARKASGKTQVGRPGVIVVAVGPGKKDIVKRAVGLINHLIIDHTLADSIVSENSQNAPQTKGSRASH